MVTGEKENFHNVPYFGSRVFVHPPQPAGRQQKGKLHVDTMKGIFLGFEEGTIRNIIWFNPKTNKVNSSCANFSFDESFNDVPSNELPPNTVQLECSRIRDGDQEEEPKNEWIDSNEFEFFASPFPHTVTHLVKLLHYDRDDEPNCFGFKFKAERLIDRAYISEIVGNTDAYNNFCALKSSKRKIIGATITEINVKPVCTVTDAINELHFIHDNAANSFENYGV